MSSLRIQVHAQTTLVGTASVTISITIAIAGLKQIVHIGSICDESPAFMGNTHSIGEAPGSTLSGKEKYAVARL
jgi:hypothetical protein